MSRISNLTGGRTFQWEEAVVLPERSVSLLGLHETSLTHICRDAGGCVHQPCAPYRTNVQWQKHGTVQTVGALSLYVCFHKNEWIWSHWCFQFPIKDEAHGVYSRPADAESFGDLTSRERIADYFHILCLQASVRLHSPTNCCNESVSLRSFLCLLNAWNTDLEYPLPMGWHVTWCFLCVKMNHDKMSVWCRELPRGIQFEALQLWRRSQVLSLSLLEDPFCGKIISRGP